jgi:hypothetical protein
VQDDIQLQKQKGNQVSCLVMSSDESSTCFYTLSTAAEHSMHSFSQIEVKESRNVIQPIANKVGFDD